MINRLFPKIHKEGYKFLAISIILLFISTFFSKAIFAILFLLTVWVYYFFRDPERISINDNKYLISPADGVVTQISEVAEGPKELNYENMKFSKVSVFMNVFDCHVNRTPLAGSVEEIFYKPGKFLNASLDKASEDNERNYYKIKTEDGDEIIIVQIAGLVARRIVVEVEKGQFLKQGERIGMIRFGSRVDLYFKNKKILVKKDQNVYAGESLIASNE